MRIIELNNRLSRALLLSATLALAASYLVFGTFRFIAAVISEPQNRVDAGFLESAAAYFPGSSAIESRLAARLLASDDDLTQSYESYAEKALYHANRAASLSPWSYEAHLLRAAALEQKGEYDEAEKALEHALRLSPNRIDLHWRLANLFIRADRIDRAVEEARLAARGDPGRLPDILNLVWQATDGDLGRLRGVTGESPHARLTLADFLAAQGREPDAAAVFTGIDRQSLGNMTRDAGKLISSLIDKKRFAEAAAMWKHASGAQYSDGIFNGDFESLLREGLTQFDWQLAETKYADIGITSKIARSGFKSLLVVFRGLDTTRINDEIRHLALVEPGVAYRLSCYVKTQDLLTEDGPRIAVASADSNAVLVESEPIGPGSRDWSPLEMRFTPPPNTGAVWVKVRQAPRFSYSKPTSGVALFDDFTVRREGAKRVE